MKILYLTHDLRDAAVHKRTAMFKDGGADVTVAGFRRGAEPVNSVAGSAAVDLGRTYDGNFPQRVLSVLREVLCLKKRRTLFEGADVIVARNLEMLAIAVRGRSLCARPPVLVYESLDIHRLLLNKGPAGKALRRLEGWLSKRASALITSSPAFVSSYFEPLSDVRLPVRMVENKVYAPGAEIPASSARTPGPPWRIGWFGALRCKKSLHILQELVRQSSGNIEVILRGSPALDQMPDFHDAVAATPGLTFAGPYKNPDDLAAIYRDVHFTWAIDMFEEGLNSSWLLPNRLYEGGLYDAVPIALKAVETGRFLDWMGLGVTLEAPLPAALRKFFGDLTIQGYQSLEKHAMETPRSCWRYNKSDCESLVGYLSTLKD